MVRLTEDRYKQITSKEAHFNTTMVRLTEKVNQADAQTYINFNTTMVRLTVAPVKVRKMNPPTFQYHYGAINGK